VGDIQLNHVQTGRSRFKKWLLAIEDLEDKKKNSVLCRKWTLAVNHAFWIV